MKKISFNLAIVVIAAGIFGSSCSSGIATPKLKSDLDTASYAIGYMNGSGFKRSLESIPGDPVNADALLAGFVASFKGDSSALNMTPQEFETYVNSYVEAAGKRADEKTKAEGEKFLEENQKRSGVITTPSGLQYKVEKEGTGSKPTATDRVKVHYTGTFLDGTAFDSSVERGEPSTLGVGQVIPGWTEGLQIMPVGSKYVFWVPYNLAYGENGTRGIRPYSMLKFEVELLEIVQ